MRVSVSVLRPGMSAAELAAFERKEWLHGRSEADLLAEVHDRNYWCPCGAPVDISDDNTPCPDGHTLHGKCSHGHDFCYDPNERECLALMLTAEQMKWLLKNSPWAFVAAPFDTPIEGLLAVWRDLHAKRADLASTMAGEWADPDHVIH